MPNTKLKRDEPVRIFDTIEFLEDEPLGSLLSLGMSTGMAVSPFEIAVLCSTWNLDRNHVQSNETERKEK